jgi:hypothetical protein
MVTAMPVNTLAASMLATVSTSLFQCHLKRVLVSPQFFLMVESTEAYPDLVSP